MFIPNAIQRLMVPQLADTSNENVFILNDSTRSSQKGFHLHHFLYAASPCIWFLSSTNFQHAGKERRVEDVEENRGSQAEIGGMFRSCAQIQQLLCSPTHHLHKPLHSIHNGSCKHQTVFWFPTTGYTFHHGLQEGEQGMDTVRLVQSIIFADAFNYTSIRHNLRTERVSEVREDKGVGQGSHECLLENIICQMVDVTTDSPGQYRFDVYSPLQVRPALLPGPNE